MENKVVVITGASSGIGKACALAFAQRGAKVVLAARKPEKLDKAVVECEKLGAEALAVKTDVAIESDCQNLMKCAVERFGGIDILINNAGISMRAAFEDLDLRRY